MVENFRRSYQELEAVRRTDIMGIYGSTHVVESEYRNSDFRMAKQLSENYGEHLHTKDLTQEPERIDVLEVNGKTYTASYFGEQDISMVKGYKTRSSGGWKTHTRTLRSCRHPVRFCQPTTTL